MSLPPESAPPPPPPQPYGQQPYGQQPYGQQPFPAGAGYPQGKPTGPRRKRWRVGWILFAISAVLGIGGLVGIIARAAEALTDIEETVTPGEVTVDCEAGDSWRIGGPVGVDNVRVTGSNNEPIQVVGRSGSSSETFTVNGREYVAVLTFRCESDGATSVAFNGPEGGRAAVFPSITDVGKSVLVFVAIMIVGIIGGIVSLILIITGRHRTHVTQ